MPIELMRQPPPSWEAYLSELKECDRLQREWNFPIFDDIDGQKSWINTISTGRQIIREDRPWNDDDAAVLLGLKIGRENWGLLGNMGARGESKNILREHQDKVRDILRKLVNVPGIDRFKQAAGEAIEHLCDIDGFGPGIATRLITLARPDCAVSVNGASSGGFATLFPGLPRTVKALGKGSNYTNLLTQIYEQPWYDSPEPQVSREQEYWSMRAALLDAFIYEPYRSEKKKQDSENAEREVERRKRQLGDLTTRPGQKEFSRYMREIYNGRCAITNCKTPCALQAAHICRLNGSDDNSAQNGLLLRSDIHALFDAFLITLSEDGKRVEVSAELLTDPCYEFLKSVSVSQPEKKLRPSEKNMLRPSEKNILSHRDSFQNAEKDRRVVGHSCLA